MTLTPERQVRDVEGKVAFITGGGSGIGLGIARVLCEAGMKVAIADVRRDHLDHALGELRKDGMVHGIALDVTDRAAMAAAAAETARELGNVQLLCNNAGVSLFGPMDAATFDDWDWLLGVNLGGVVNGLHAFLPQMKASGAGGHIVNTASMAGLITGPGMGIYCASKFAVVGLTASLRCDLAPHGIGVSVLCPGFVRSNIHEAVLSRPARYSATGYKVGPEEIQRLDQVLSVGMDPVDVGRAVLEGVRRNDLYVFPHAEFRDELRAIFDEVLAALPERAADPARMAMEDGRRRRRQEAAAAADALK